MPVNGSASVRLPASLPRLGERRAYADLDAAERRGQVVEPGQVDLDEVVDVLAGDRLARWRSVAAWPAWLACRYRSALLSLPMFSFRYCV